MAGIPRNVVEYLSAVPVFGGVGRRGLRSIAAAADEVRARAGQTVVREGESGEHLYVLLDGKARVTRGGRLVATFGPGDFFGELALLSRAPRTATVTATEDSRLLVVSPREFKVVLEREPSIVLSILQAVAQRIRESERALTH